MIGVSGIWCFAQLGDTAFNVEYRCHDCGATTRHPSMPIGEIGAVGCYRCGCKLPSTSRMITESDQPQPVDPKYTDDDAVKTAIDSWTDKQQAAAYLYLRRALDWNEQKAENARRRG